MPSCCHQLVQPGCPASEVWRCFVVCSLLAPQSCYSRQPLRRSERLTTSEPAVTNLFKHLLYIQDDRPCSRAVQQHQLARMPPKVKRIMTQPIVCFVTAICSVLNQVRKLTRLSVTQNLIFRFLQSRQKIQIWLFEQQDLRIEGRIIVSWIPSLNSSSALPAALCQWLLICRALMST